MERFPGRVFIYLCFEGKMSISFFSLYLNASFHKTELPTPTPFPLSFFNSRLDFSNGLQELWFHSFILSFSFLFLFFILFIFCKRLILHILPCISYFLSDTAIQKDKITTFFSTIFFIYKRMEYSYWEKFEKISLNTRWLIGIILKLQCCQNVFVIHLLSTRQFLIFSFLQSIQSHATT